jgi:probable rRNA maturation factor
MPNQRIKVQIDIAVQNATSVISVPSKKQFERWASAALHEHGDAELLIRLVDRQESRQLNARYRHKDKATNVLSFAADLPEEVGLKLLGDIIICAPVVVEEAEVQHKTVEAHWAHLTIHGILHLLGHNHQAKEETFAMESLETGILQFLGFPDPYFE